jgi:hypothetical protein
MFSKLREALKNYQPRWADRLWVVQEFVHARRLVFAFGNRTVDFWDPDNKSVLDGDHISPDDNSTAPDYERETWTLLKEIARDMIVLKEGNNWPDLLETTKFTCAAACQDPRDKIFAILSIIAGPRMIEVDYIRPKSEVFALATHSSLAPNQGCKARHYVRLQGISPSVPTWTIDFTCGQCPHLNINIETAISGTIRERRRIPNFREPDPWPAWPETAGGDEDLRLNRSSWRLTLKGKPFDMVNIKGFYRLHDATLNIPDPKCAPQTCAPDRNSQPSRPGNFDYICEYAKCASGSACIFLTSSSFWGVGPCTMRSGDEIVLLRHSDFPVIFRRDEYEDCYTFQGICYMDQP